MNDWPARSRVKLVACRAARRFVRCLGNNSRHGSIWYPILFYWRRRTRHADIQVASKVSGGRAMWLPRFRRHLGVRQSDHTSHGPSRIPYGAITKLELQRIVHEHQWMMSRSSMDRASTQPCHCVPGVSLYAAQLVQRAEASRPISMRSSSLLITASKPNIGMPISSRLGRLSIVALRNSGEGNESFAQRVVLKRDREIVWTEQELVTKSRLQRGKPIRQWTMLHGEAISPLVKPKTMFRGQTNAVTKSAWRHDSQSSLNRLDLGSHSEVPLLFRQQPGSMFHQVQVVGAPSLSNWAMPPEGSTANPSWGAQPMQLPGRTGRATVMQGETIDPILLNRLTDDVIRRVEQRIRIERERRGL